MHLKVNKRTRYSVVVAPRAPSPAAASGLVRRVAITALLLPLPLLLEQWEAAEAEAANDEAVERERDGEEEGAKTKEEERGCCCC